MSTSKWLSWFLRALAVTNFVLSRTAKMLLRYAAGSIFGSGGLGMAICGSEPKLELGCFAERGDCMLSLAIEGLISPEWEDLLLLFRPKRPISTTREGDACRLLG